MPQLQIISRGQETGIKFRTGPYFIMHAFLIINIRGLLFFETMHIPKSTEYRSISCTYVINKKKVYFPPFSLCLFVFFPAFLPYTSFRFPGLTPFLVFLLSLTHWLFAIHSPTSLAEKHKNEDMISISLFTSLIMEPVRLNIWKLSRMLSDHQRCIQWCEEHKSTLVVFKLSKTAMRQHLELAKTRCIGRWICLAMLEEKLQWKSINQPELMVFW